MEFTTAISTCYKTENQLYLFAEIRSSELIDDMIHSGKCVANWRTNLHPHKEYIEG